MAETSGVCVHIHSLYRDACGKGRLPGSLLVLVRELRKGKVKWLRTMRGNPQKCHCARRTKLISVHSEEDDCGSCYMCKRS